MLNNTTETYIAKGFEGGIDEIRYWYSARPTSYIISGINKSFNYPSSEIDYYDAQISGYWPIEIIRW